MAMKHGRMTSSECSAASCNACGGASGAGVDDDVSSAANAVASRDH